MCKSEIMCPSDISCKKIFFLWCAKGGRCHCLTQDYKRLSTAKQLSLFSSSIQIMWSAFFNWELTKCSKLHLSQGSITVCNHSMSINLIPLHFCYQKIILTEIFLLLLVTETVLGTWTFFKTSGCLNLFLVVENYSLVMNLQLICITQTVSLFLVGFYPGDI